jgi:hypothetical protein
MGLPLLGVIDRPHAVLVGSASCLQRRHDYVE